MGNTENYILSKGDTLPIKQWRSIYNVLPPQYQTWTQLWFKINDVLSKDKTLESVFFEQFENDEWLRYDIDVRFVKLKAFDELIAIIGNKETVGMCASYMHLDGIWKEETRNMLWKIYNTL